VGASEDLDNGFGEVARQELFESKLHPPPPRRALVSRSALVERLETSGDVPITVVAAPPGYGKTTLLAEWSQCSPSQFAWLSIDRHDNDLDRLATCCR
jgi:LuxR family maltose regulon positive regulatory protein